MQQLATPSAAKVDINAGLITVSCPSLLKGWAILQAVGATGARGDLPWSQLVKPPVAVAWALN